MHRKTKASHLGSGLASGAGRDLHLHCTAMDTLSLLQGGGILLTVLLAALYAAWRIHLGIKRERDIFVLIGGTFALVLLALLQVILLIARTGTSGH